MYNLNTPHPSLQIYLDSRTATIKKSNSDLIFHFNDKIIVSQNIDILISVVDFEIPLSHYNITKNNNKLVIEYENNDIETIYFEEGIYSACSLVEYFKTEILDESNLIEIFYNEKTNYIYLVSNQNFNIVNSVLGEIINLNNDIIIQDNKYYYGSYLNLSSASSIYVHCPTYKTGNLSSKKQGLCDTICKIPINNHIGTILIWQNQSSFKTKISEKTISDIEIILKDENDNILNLENNCHWTMTIQIDFIYKNKFIPYLGLNRVKKNKIIGETPTNRNNKNNFYEIKTKSKGFKNNLKKSSIYKDSKK